MTAGTSARVASIGECMIELSKTGDGLLSESFGGDSLNTAVYLARLGVRVVRGEARGASVRPLGDPTLKYERAIAIDAARIHNDVAALFTEHRLHRVAPEPDDSSDRFAISC